MLWPAPTWKRDRGARPKTGPPGPESPHRLGQMAFVLTSYRFHLLLTLARTQSSHTRSKAVRAQAGPGQPLPPSPTVCPLLPRLTEAVTPFWPPCCCGTSLLRVCPGVRSLLPRVRHPSDSIREPPVLSCPGSDPLLVLQEEEKEEEQDGEEGTPPAGPEDEDGEWDPASRPHTH